MSDLRYPGYGYSSVPDVPDEMYSFDSSSFLAPYKSGVSYVDNPDEVSGDTADDTVDNETVDDVSTESDDELNDGSMPAGVASFFDDMSAENERIWREASEYEAFASASESVESGPEESEEPTDSVDDASDSEASTDANEPDSSDEVSDGDENEVEDATDETSADEASIETSEQDFSVQTDNEPVEEPESETSDELVQSPTALATVVSSAQEYGPEDNLALYTEEFARRYEVSEEEYLAGSAVREDGARMSILELVSPASAFASWRLVVPSDIRRFGYSLDISPEWPFDREELDGKFYRYDWVLTQSVFDENWSAQTHNPGEQLFAGSPTDSSFDQSVNASLSELFHRTDGNDEQHGSAWHFGPYPIADYVNGLSPDAPERDHEMSLRISRLIADPRTNVRVGVVGNSLASTFMIVDSTVGQSVHGGYVMNGLLPFHSLCAAYLDGKSLEPFAGLLRQSSDIGYGPTEQAQIVAVLSDIEDMENARGADIAEHVRVDARDDSALSADFSYDRELSESVPEIADVDDMRLDAYLDSEDVEQDREMRADNEPVETPELHEPIEDPEDVKEGSMSEEELAEYVNENGGLEAMGIEIQSYFRDAMLGWPKPAAEPVHPPAQTASEQSVEQTESEPVGEQADSASVHDDADTSVDASKSSEEPSNKSADAGETDETESDEQAEQGSPDSSEHESADEQRAEDGDEQAADEADDSKDESCEQGEQEEPNPVNDTTETKDATATPTVPETQPAPASSSVWSADIPAEGIFLEDRSKTSPIRVSSALLEMFKERFGCEGMSNPAIVEGVLAMHVGVSDMSGSDMQSFAGVKVPAARHLAGLRNAVMAKDALASSGASTGTSSSSADSRAVLSSVSDVSAAVSRLESMLDSTSRKGEREQAVLRNSNETILRLMFLVEADRLGQLDDTGLSNLLNDYQEGRLGAAPPVASEVVSRYVRFMKKAVADAGSSFNTGAPNQPYRAQRAGTMGRVAHHVDAPGVAPGMANTDPTDAGSYNPDEMFMQGHDAFLSGSRDGHLFRSSPDYRDGYESAKADAARRVL